jgi:hypothetical protein
MGSCKSDSVGQGQQLTVGFGDHGNRQSGCTKDEFCAQVTGDDLLKQCAPYIYKVTEI